MSGVSNERIELTVKRPTYNMIADCIDGEKAVKDRGDTYLPRPNALDMSPGNQQRYELYKERAVFYNVTARTLKGFVGEIFSAQPKIEVPTELETMVDNVDGSSISLTQQSKEAVEMTLAFGRCGIFTDYPFTGGGLTVRQLQEAKINPTMTLYDPRKILDWSVKQRGAEKVLDFVKLEETREYRAGFDIETETVYRVLRLGLSPGNTIEGMIDDPDVYTVEIYDKNGLIEAFQPRDKTGRLFDTINFDFIGSENNDSKIDNPPLYDLASLNIHHYQNSADYEESCHWTGQPTLVISGITKDWYEDMLGGTIKLGSRAVIPLQPDSDAKFLQSEENGQPKEAMDHKERQMASLGAAIVEQRSVQRTATETSIESISEKSVLANVVDNVSQAYESALRKAYRFVSSAQDAEIVFRLNSNFKISKLAPSELSAVISGWQSGVYSWAEVRRHAVLAGLELEPDEQALAEIEEQQRAKDERDARKIQQQGGGAVPTKG